MQILLKNLQMKLWAVLISEESNFDKKSVPTTQSFIRKEVSSYKIHTLELNHVILAQY